jgi:hypothetical protein
LTSAIDFNIFNAPWDTESTLHLRAKAVLEEAKRQGKLGARFNHALQV